MKKFTTIFLIIIQLVVFFRPTESYAAPVAIPAVSSAAMQVIVAILAGMGIVAYDVLTEEDYEKLLEELEKDEKLKEWQKQLEEENHNIDDTLDNPEEPYVLVKNPNGEYVRVSREYYEREFLGVIDGGLPDGSNIPDNIKKKVGFPIPEGMIDYLVKKVLGTDPIYPQYLTFEKADMTIQADLVDFIMSKKLKKIIGRYSSKLYTREEIENILSEHVGDNFIYVLDRSKDIRTGEISIGSDLLKLTKAGLPIIKTTRHESLVDIGYIKYTEIYNYITFQNLTFLFDNLNDGYKQTVSIEPILGKPKGHISVPHVITGVVAEGVKVPDKPKFYPDLALQVETETKRLMEIPQVGKTMIALPYNPNRKEGDPFFVPKPKIIELPDLKPDVIIAPPESAPDFDPNKVSPIVLPIPKNPLVSDLTKPIVIPSPNPNLIPNPNPIQNPNPILPTLPPKDMDNPPDFDLPKLDFSPLNQPILDKFPFCLPYDLALSIGMFRSRSSWVPVWEVPFLTEKITVDLRFMEKYFFFARSIFLMIFIVGLIHATNRLIGRG